MEPSLLDPDPERRIAAIRALRYRDLKDPAVLAAALRAARDLTSVRASAASDPFASFFDAGAAAAGTVAAVAAERLDRTGLPPDEATLDALVRALGEEGPAGMLPAVAARALAETRWPDLETALRRLIPALDPHDQPLFEAIVALPSAATPVLAELAAEPIRLRLLQELMNHPPSHGAAVAAVEAAAVRSPPETGALSSLLGVLAGWGEPAAARIARAVADRAPWAVAWAAVVDDDSAAELAAWLDAGAPQAPAGLWGRVSEVLRQRGLSDAFPLAAWLRASGEDHGLCRGHVGSVGVAEVLQDWVRALADGQGPPERGWTAAWLLCEAGLHGPIAEAIGRALGRGPVPWEGALLSALAAADPPVPGLADAIAAGLDPEDPAPAIEAVRQLGPSEMRRTAEAVLAAAARAERRVERHGRGTVREAPVGVDVEAIAPLVEALADPAISARYDAVVPVLRAG